MTSDQPKRTRYKRPPITEAVIECRFATPMNLERLQKLKDGLSATYSVLEEVHQIQFQMTIGKGKPSVNDDLLGYRMFSMASTGVITITLSAVSYARLAPYGGWDSFSSEFMNTFERMKALLGHQPLMRIGMRYINRLDIPVEQESSLVRIENYLTIHPEYPGKDLPPLTTWTMQSVFHLTQVGCYAAVTVASVASPVPQRTSFLLDVDISRETNVPQNDREIRELLALMRDEKNRVFEACITDATRRLFDQ